MMQFYIRVTTGHIGKYGKEIEEIEIIDGKTINYYNISNYKSLEIINDKLLVTHLISYIFLSIIYSSQILKESDILYPKKDPTGFQEIEIYLDGLHISLKTIKSVPYFNYFQTRNPDGLYRMFSCIKVLKKYHRKSEYLFCYY